MNRYTQISLTISGRLFWKDTEYFMVLRVDNIIGPQEGLEQARGTERSFTLQIHGPECLLPHVLSAAYFPCSGKP